MLYALCLLHALTGSLGYSFPWVTFDPAEHYAREYLCAVDAAVRTQERASTQDGPMANLRENRIKRAEKEVAREQRSVDRVAAKFATLTPADKEYARVEKDLAQQRAQLKNAQDALAHAQRPED